MTSTKKPTTATPGTDPAALLRVTPRIRIPHREFHFDFTHSSGPGGQHVNKVRTKAVLHWDLATSPSLKPDVKERFHQKYAKRLRKDGVLVLNSQRTRDAHSNQKDCLDKLKAMLLAVAVAPKPRKKTRPKKAAREERLTLKHRVSDKKKTRGRIRTLD
jgi:ribosome-associated protein